MQIQHLKYQEIDKLHWDAALERSFNKLIYASSEFLDKVCDGNWEALVSEDWKWIMPLTLKKKWGISYLPTPLFVQQLGIFGPEAPSMEIIKAFIDALPKKIRLIEYQFNHHNLKLLDVRIAAIIRRNLILQIPKDFKNNKSSLYNSNTLRNVRKAQAEGLSIVPCSPMLVANLFKNNRGKTLKNVNIRWIRIFENVTKKQCKSLVIHANSVVNEKEETLAGIVVFEAFERHILIITANTEEGKSRSAMHLLIDAYLSTIPEGHTFDFEGSDNQGLALFYKGFGASEANYLHLKINNLPWWLKWIKR